MSAASHLPDEQSATNLTVGLQEWAACCRALIDGRLILAVRKGGVHERYGGLFSLEHPRFALLPTHLHQDSARLLPAFADEVRATSTDPAPGRIAVEGWAEAAQVWKVTELERVQALGAELAWTAAELASRFHYREQPWLYVVALRVHRLPARQEIPDRPAYAGCRSWIQLQDAIDIAGSQPTLGEAAFAERIARIAQVLGASTFDPPSSPASGK